MTRQFRYYLVELDLPEVAIRFKEAVRKTAQTISRQPRAAPLFPLHNPNFQSLRSWPVAGFEAIRFYFLVEDEIVRVVRILHGKRDIRGILKREKK